MAQWVKVWCPVFWFHSVARASSTAKTTWIGKGLFHWTLPGHNPLLREPRQILKERNYEETIEELCMLACSLDCAQMAFLYSSELKTSHLGMAPSMMGWALIHWLAIKIMSHEHAHRLTWSRKFLSWGSLFPGDCRLCRVDSKGYPARHVSLRTWFWIPSTCVYKPDEWVWVSIPWGDGGRDRIISGSGMCSKKWLRVPDSNKVIGENRLSYLYMHAIVRVCLYKQTPIIYVCTHSEPQLAIRGNNPRGEKFQREEMMSESINLTIVFDKLSIIM